MQNILIRQLFPAAATIVIVYSVCSSAFATSIEPSFEPIQKQNLINRIELLQTDGLKRALAIDAKLSAKMVAIINANKQRRAVLDNTYKEQMAELKRVIDNAGSNEIATLVSRLEQTTNELQTLYIQKWKALKALLTDKQQARYLLYQDALQRELQRRTIKGLNRSATGE